MVTARYQRELVHRYSKHDLTGIGLDRLVRVLKNRAPAVRATPTSRHRHKLEQRPEFAELAAQVVAEYEAGMPTTVLAREYGLGKSSVQRLLREGGVELRRSALSDVEVAEVVRLYRMGLSIAEIGTRLQRSPSTVWRCLTDRGVEMRHAGRPPRQ